jgi:RTA1 like protein
MQICTLIFGTSFLLYLDFSSNPWKAPAFFAAGIYIILGRLIRTFGSHVSPITPNTYLYIFCGVDLISLVVQAVGGGAAATAFEKIPPENSGTGTHIMVAGILFQLASIIVFSLLFTYVITKALRSRGEILKQKKIQYVIAATAFSVVVLVIRSIYRTIELLQGWNGYLINTERYFIALDGTMMILFVGAFNFVQPRWSEGWEGKTGGVLVRGEEMVTASGEGHI